MTFPLPPWDRSHRAYRRTATEDDFLVAGRSIGPIVGGATLAATQLSSGTVVGTVGYHYLTGVSFAWIWPGVWLGWLDRNDDLASKTCIRLLCRMHGLEHASADRKKRRVEARLWLGTAGQPGRT